MPPTRCFRMTVGRSCRRWRRQASCPRDRVPRARLADRHGLRGVEERDRRGLRGGSLSVLPFDVEIVAGVCELCRDPYVSDVALEARRPDKVGDAAHALPSSQRRTRVGDLEERRIAGRLNADELAGDAVLADMLEGTLPDVVGVLLFYQPLEAHYLERVVVQGEVGTVVEDAGLDPGRLAL